MRVPSRTGSWRLASAAGHRMPRSPREDRWVSDWPGRQPAGKADPAGDRDPTQRPGYLQCHRAMNAQTYLTLSTEEAIPHTHGPHKLSIPPSGKSLGGLTTGPRPLLTGNLTPVPREASVWYTCQMSTRDSASGQVGSLMPGAWSAKNPAPSADSLGIDPSCPGLFTLVWILQCACGSSEEMVCFLLRRPVSYSHASWQVARWPGESQQTITPLNNHLMGPDEKLLVYKEVSSTSTSFLLSGWIFRRKPKDP